MKKKRDEFRLYQLYALCAYVECYTLDRDNGTSERGGVLVFNLQSNKDENITEPWENLCFGCGDLSLTLTFDTSSEREMLKKLENSYSLLWRTDNDFSREEFDSRYCGIVPVSSIDANCDLGKSILTSRLRFQYLLARVFDLLKTPTPYDMC